MLRRGGPGRRSRTVSRSPWRLQGVRGRRAPRLREPGLSWRQRAPAVPWEQRARRRARGRTGAGERKVSRAQTGRVWTTAARAVPIHPPASRAVAFVSPKAASERPTRGPGPGACGAWPGASVPPGSPWPGLGRAPPGPSRPGSALPDGGRAPSLSSVPPASHRGSGTFPRGASGLRLQAGNRGHLETEESNATFLNRRMAWRTLFQADSFDCSGSIIMHVSLLNVAL